MRSSVTLASAALEAVTGLGLLIVPPLVVRLLLGAELAGPGVATARLCGLALFSVGVACWPQGEPTAHRPDRRVVRALLVYNGLATAYLVCLRALDGYRGILLVPAIVVHAVLAALLAREIRRPDRARRSERFDDVVGGERP
jgi:hypothetical protein